MKLITLAEAGYLPDPMIRAGIRRLLKQRLADSESRTAASRNEYLTAFVDELRVSPLALETQAANDQHYEVPAEFYKLVLGPRLKYSCCLFEEESTSLEKAEQAMLQLTCDRAKIADGMDILELGCGWGSLSLWIAEHYPNCRITSLSNSSSQREFISQIARQKGLDNLHVITADMREFETRDRFDRVISVEMFEHMRNYQELLHRVATWLKPQGKTFVHIFCHRDTPYLFESEGDDNWMGRHFFTGGMMPSADLISRFNQDLVVDSQWQVDGTHYQRTCEAWLDNLDRNRKRILQIFEDQKGDRRSANVVLNRWRIFFMACSELFGFKDGYEWYVAHYLMDLAQSPEPRKIVRPVAATPAP